MKKELELTTAYNTSLYFLLPFTFIPKSYFDKMTNCFALCSQKQNLDNHIFVLFDKDLIEDYELSRFQTFNTYESIEDVGQYYLLTFKIHPQFKGDRDLFLEGRYSKYSEKGKKAVGGYFAFREEISKGKFADSETFKILYPTKKERLRLAEIIGEALEEDAEIYSSPYINKEIFNVDNYYSFIK